MTDYITNYSFQETDDLSIKIASFNETKVVLKDNEIKNPLFVAVNSSNLSYYKDEKELYSTHKRILVLCVKQTYDNTNNANNVIAEQIFNPIVSKDVFSRFPEFFTLMTCSRRIINSKHQYNNALIVNKEILEPFNSHYIKLEDTEILIPMFELKEDMAKMHINLYDTENTAVKIPNVLSLNNYYNADYTQRTHAQLSQLLMSIKESNYWNQPYNCTLSMTEQFTERSFEFRLISEDKLKKNIANRIDTATALTSVISTLKKNNGYHLANTYKPDAFVDMSTALKAQEKRTYYATVDNDNLNITKEQVTQVFNTLDISKERELFDIFNTLLISKEYCHMVLNNREVLTKMEPIIQKYIPLYKYLIGYAWVCFYTEECLFKTKTTKSSRYVFDIRTANKLPLFPFSTEDVYQNPYLTFLVSEKASDIQNNCMTVGTMEDYQGCRIDTLEKFVWKFNLFTTGDASKNIFDGLVWGDKYAVSGSMIPAFLQTKPYLFDLVSTGRGVTAGSANKTDTESAQWLTYFTHYYPKSDIDFMCNEESVFDFIDSINNVKSIVEKNLDVPRVDVEPIKSTTIVITEHYLREKLADIRDFTCNPNLTVTDIMSTIETNTIKEYFHNVYYETKKKNNRTQRSSLRTRNNLLYEDYFKVASVDDINIVIVDYEIGKDSNVEKDCETCTYLNDIVTKHVAADKNIMVFKISENIKFKLKSDKLLHCIEAFRAKSKDFFAVVGRFHLPCVRGYYNGETVYMEPSCVTANMTGINIDYKYFAGVRDPIDILNKYRMRGFGTILNASEKQHMSYYNSKLPEVARMFNLNVPTTTVSTTGPKSKKEPEKNTTAKKENINSIYGFKDLNDDMYKIAHYHDGIPLDVYNKIEKKQIKTQAELQQLYASKLKYDVNKAPINMFKFKTINSDGNVNPLQKWVIEACWSSMQSHAIVDS